MPEVTVVITAYNLEKYLPECLDALRNQTFRDFDLLIVNDCSKDSTPQIVSRFAEEHPGRVQFVSTAHNLGKPGRVRNYALDSGLVTGKYVIFLDGDDTPELTFLEKLHTAAERDGAQIALCAYDRFEDGTGHVLCEEMRGFPGVIELPAEDDVLAFLNGSLWNKLIRTEIIGDVRIPDFSVGEDLCFGLALFGKCTRIACVDEVLLHYRVHAGSVISNTDLATIRAFAAECARLLDETKTQPLLHDMIALVTFIHIGISMAMRAWDNGKIDNRAFLRENRDYLKRQGLLSGSRFLRLSSLRRHGVRGAAIWACKVCYRLRAMGAFLGLYNLFKKCFKIDVKF